MKKLSNYQTPEVDVLVFSNDDVVRTSGNELNYSVIGGQNGWGSGFDTPSIGGLGE